jgi:predicted Ser/Thr protein kinase
MEDNAVELGSPGTLAETAPHGSRFTAPTPDQLARHFPHFEVLELLGQGGMGAVYKARQRSLDRLVAIKILPLEVGREPTFAERFTREARALARLSHPNIVAIHDFGQADGLYYFIMEYVDGVSLRQLVDKHELTPQQALALVPQICEALQFAHEEGIVHRDVKPENILIDKRGRVRIADFGLAKLLGYSGDAATLTRVEQVMGTPQYMAPEQMQRSHSVDHRADIYSLGVVIYEMLTGELPLGHFAPPSQKVSIDVRLDQVVLRALEREPERRYQRASDVKSDVEAIAAGRGLIVPQETAFSDVTDKVFRNSVRRAAVALLVAGIFGCYSPAAMRGPYGPAVILLPASGVLSIVAACAMFWCRAYIVAVCACVVSIALSPLDLALQIDIMKDPNAKAARVIVGWLNLSTVPLAGWATVVLVRPRTRSEFARLRRLRAEARAMRRRQKKPLPAELVVSVACAGVSAIGAGTLFCPWAQTAASSAIGFEWLEGLLVFFIFVGITALLLATASLPRMPFWRPVVIGLAALVAGGTTAHFLAKLSGGRLLHGAEADISIGPYLAMIAAVAVIMLTAIETNLGIRRRNRAEAVERSPKA